MKIFSIVLLFMFNQNISAQVYLNAGFGSCRLNGLDNLKVHAAAINENTPNVKRPMKIGSLASGMGFQLGIQKDDLRIYVGWQYRSNVYRMNDEAGNSLHWKLNFRKTTLIGLSAKKDKFETGFGVDVGSFNLKQNSKGISTFSQGKPTNNTNGYEYYYAKKFRMFGAHVFTSYYIKPFCSIRLTYNSNFLPVKAKFTEDLSTSYLYNLSNFDISITFHSFKINKNEKK